MWALGCVVHEILTLKIPFLEPISASDRDWLDLQTAQPPPQPDMDILSDFCSGRAKFPAGILRQSQVSECGISFVESLLVADPQSRLSAKDALQSPWLLEGITR